MDAAATWLPHPTPLVDIANGSVTCYRPFPRVRFRSRLLRPPPPIWHVARSRGLADHAAIN